MTREEIQKIIEKLSELRSGYSCFDEDEEPFYRALSTAIKAIKALEQEPILDKIRAEIQDNRDEWIKGQDPEWHAYNRCLWIVDKYKAKSEVQ